MDPACRRQGKATLLLDLLAQDAERIFLEVAADNGPARAMYGAYGFSETGTRTGYYKRQNGDRVDAVTLHWALTSR